MCWRRWTPPTLSAAAWLWRGPPTERRCWRIAKRRAEGAGAASLAGLMADPTRQGLCAIVCTGGNADDHELAGISAGSVVGTDATLNC